MIVPALLIGFVAICFANAQGPIILDGAHEPISSICEHVCGHTTGSLKQISKISTVIALDKYLSSLPAENELSACARLYRDATSELGLLVSRDNENVCSADKIKAIEHFHRVFILKGAQQRDSAPKILKTFFYHYAHAVSNICATETASFLASMSDPSSASTTEIDKLFAEMSERIGIPLSSRLEYKDMFLIWSQVDALPKKFKARFERYLLDGNYRVAVAARDSETLLKMQDVCREQAKPLYSYSLLSTIRLIDLGFYPSSTEVLEQLNSNRQARRFYELTKVCEVLLPVRVLEQQASSGSEIIFLSREQVALLEPNLAQPEPSPPSEACRYCSIAGVDELLAVAHSGMDVAKKVRKDVKGRKSAIARLLGILIHNVKANFPTSMRRLIGLEDVGTMESIDENQLDHLEVKEDGSYDSDAIVVRSKRGVISLISTVAGGLYKAFIFLLYIVFWFLSIFVILPVGAIYAVFRWITHLKSESLDIFFTKIADYALISP